MRKHYESYNELTTRDKNLWGKTLPKLYGNVHFEEIYVKEPDRSTE